MVRMTGPWPLAGPSFSFPRPLLVISPSTFHSGSGNISPEITARFVREISDMLEFELSVRILLTGVKFAS